MKQKNIRIKSTDHMSQKAHTMMRRQLASIAVLDSDIDQIEKGGSLLDALDKLQHMCPFCHASGQKLTSFQLSRSTKGKGGN